MPQDERKVTEDLLAGFDRTGRTPRVPPVRAPDARRDMATVSLRPPRAIWPWVAIGVVFALTIGTVVMLALPDERVAPAPVPSASSVATPAPPPTPSIVVDIAPVTSTPASASAPPRPAAQPPPKPRDDQRGDFVRTL